VRAPTVTVTHMDATSTDNAQSSSAHSPIYLAGVRSSYSKLEFTISASTTKNEVGAAPFATNPGLLNIAADGSPEDETTEVEDDEYGEYVSGLSLLNPSYSWNFENMFD
jgi:hypothetical protein